MTKYVIRADLIDSICYWGGKYWTPSIDDALRYNSEADARAEIQATVAEDGPDGVWGEDAAIIPVE